MTRGRAWWLAWAVVAVGCTCTGEASSFPDGGPGEVGRDGGRGGGAGGGRADAGAGGGGFAAGAGGGGSGSVDAGPLDLDAGPVDLTCLLDGGLSPLETRLAQLPADTWTQAPGTDFSTFCHAHQVPALAGYEGCDAVISDWSGGAFDEANRQLLLWGGGHHGYFGNEVYAFSLSTGQWALASQPSPLPTGADPSEPMGDGRPVSRHTYDNLVYVPGARRLLAFGGATAPVGSSTDSVWLFDPAAGTWQRRADMYPTGAGHFFIAAALDPVSNHVLTRDELGLWDYDLAADRWRRLVDYGYPPYYPTYTTYHYRKGVVLPAQRLFLAVGGALADGGPDVVAYDLDAGQDISAAYTQAGDTSVIKQGGAGLDYAPSAKALVAWSGGPVGIFDLATRTWTRGTGVGAPAAPVENGTYGRFRYLAYLNVFILVNKPGEDVWFYKLTQGCGQ